MKSKDIVRIIFYVKRFKRNKNGETPVFVRITVNGKRAEISIGQNVHPDAWNPEKGCALENTDKNIRLNTYMEIVRGQVYTHLSELRSKDQEITAERLKMMFLGIDEDTKYMIQVYKEHNDKCAQLVGEEFSPDTLQRYRTCLMHTQEFIRKKYKANDLPLNKIDHEFIMDYEHYFKTVRKCAHNTTMKYLKNFKKIIRIALANGWMQKDPFANYKMNIKKIDREFLSDEELERIMHKELHTDRLNLVRDCFIFSCFTGLAYSDLKGLTPDNIKTGIDSKKWVMTHRKKTKNASNIPLLPAAEAILQKYKEHPVCRKNNVLLPVLTNQKMNAYLKEIADICGIKKNLSSHTARHTFATTVTLNNDVPIESVSKMLGHSSINMTRIYARLLDKKVSQDMEHLYVKYE